MSDYSGVLARLARRMNLMVGRGKIQQSKDDGPVQMVQVALSALELADLRRVSEFGLASWPPDKCGAVVVFVNGDRSNGVVIGTHDLPSRFKLANKGEVALFDALGANGVAGKWIWLKKDLFEIEAGGKPLVVNNAKKVTVNAGTDGVELNVQGVCVLNAQDNVTLNMNGKNITIVNPGTVVLSDQNGQKNVARHGDAVVGGFVVASQTAVKA